MCVTVPACMCTFPNCGDEPLLDAILDVNPSYVGRVFSGDDCACECDNFRCVLGRNGQSCSGECETLSTIVYRVQN